MEHDITFPDSIIVVFNENNDDIKWKEYMNSIHNPNNNPVCTGYCVF